MRYTLFFFMVNCDCQKCILMFISGDEESIHELTRKLHSEIDRNSAIDERLCGYLRQRQAGDGKVPEELNNVLEKVSAEGVRLLSLSEARAAGAEFAELKQAWSDERESLVSAVAALRGLLAQTQRTTDTSKVRRNARWIHSCTFNTDFCLICIILV